jgi:hypothetical protein
MDDVKVVKCSKEELEYLKPVMGQLSDGIWENSPRMEPYWLCNHLKPEGITMHPFNSCWRNKVINNPLYHKTPTEVRSWFADKLKTVVKQWLEDNGDNPKNWNPSNTDEVWYLNTSQTVAGAYKVYKSLKKII